jgi:N-ethylmaleimide reductase
MSTTASPLFTPAVVAGQTLDHRVVMAPMTRARSTQPGDVPNAMNARYYAQRASAALIVTEATQISPQGKGYSFTPGIHSPEQVAGWRLVTDAVHAAGGRIFVQLWHVGRMSHPDFHDGELPVAPSAVPFEAQIWKVDPATGVGAMVDCPTPRALTRDEIGGVVADFRKAARNAMEAGFDGVEIHGANGYLIDQFLRTTSNVRTDEYGGSRENRLRFLKEVVTAVADEAGADRTAIRLAPFLTARGMACPDILPTILEATEFLQARGVAYLHLVNRGIPPGHPYSLHAADYRRGQLRRDACRMGAVERLCGPRCLRPAAYRKSGLPAPARRWPAGGQLRRQHALRRR